MAGREVKGGPADGGRSRRRAADPAGDLAQYAEGAAGGRVFVGPKGATLRRTNFQAMWVEARDKAGLPAGFRYHDLRHTGNTWAAGSGANLRELMERMATARRGWR